MIMFLLWGQAARDSRSHMYSNDGFNFDPDEYDVVDEYSGGMVTYYAIPRKSDEFRDIEEYEQTLDSQTTTDSSTSLLPAERFLLLILRDYQIGDLAEAFVIHQSRYGLMWAKILYWDEVAYLLWYSFTRIIKWATSARP